MNHLHPCSHGFAMADGRRLVMPWSTPGLVASYMTPPRGQVTLRASGGYVAGVTDVSPGGVRHTVELTEASQPAYALNAGANEWFTTGTTGLSTSYTGSLGLNGVNQPFSFVWVGRMLAGTATRYVLRIYSGADYLLLYAAATGVVFRRYVAAVAKSTTAYAWVQDQRAMWVGTFDGTNMSVYKGTALVAGPTDGTHAGSMTTTSIVLGAAASGASEADVYNRCLSPADITQIYAGVKQRWPGVA